MGKLLQGLRAGAGSRLFVHCGTSVEYLAELSASSPAVDRYAERALLLAERQDIVCVTHKVEPAYLEFLAGLGVGPHPANLINTARFESGGGPLWKRLLGSDAALDFLSWRMRSTGASQLHPFISTKGQFDLARELGARTGAPVRVVGGDPELVAYADCKHHIRAKALELGIPVAPGEVVRLGGCEKDRQQDYAILSGALERQAGRTGRVIIRGASGAAGSATFIGGGTRRDLENLADWLSRRTDSRTYLVEAMVNVLASPNVQILVSADGSTECVGISDQLLDSALTHRGNAYPSQAHCTGEMIRWAMVLGEWLGGMGYIGIAGFDFVEYIDRDGRARAFLAELNPRVNGATYPLAVRERLEPAAAFVSGTIATEIGSFAELRERLPQLLYSREREYGILPYMTGCLAFGTCGIIALAPTRRQAAQLFAQAERRLAPALVRDEAVMSLAGPP